MRCVADVVEQPQEVLAGLIAHACADRPQAGRAGDGRIAPEVGAEHVHDRTRIAGEVACLGSPGSHRHPEDLAGEGRQDVRRLRRPVRTQRDQHGLVVLREPVPRSGRERCHGDLPGGFGARRNSLPASRPTSVQHRGRNRCARIAGVASPPPPPPRPAARGGGWIRGLFLLRPVRWTWMTPFAQAPASVGWWRSDGGQATSRPRFLPRTSET